MRFGRRKRRRNIEVDHTSVCFKPCDVRRASIENIELGADEMEAVRLSDLEGLYQEECAQRMGISRTTFSRIVESAHKKISDALLNNKAIVVAKQEHKENHSTGD